MSKDLIERAESIKRLQAEIDAAKDDLADPSAWRRGRALSRPRPRAR